MAMIARSPVVGSAQKTTCSWRWSGVKTPIAHSKRRMGLSVGVLASLSHRVVGTGPRSVRRSRRAGTLYLLPARLRAPLRLRQTEPDLLARVRARRPGGDARRGSGASAHHGARGARGALEPPARSARRRVRAAVRRAHAD